MSLNLLFMKRKNLVLAALAALAIGSAASSALAQPGHAASQRVPTAAELEATRVHYRTTEVDGIKIFYREAGDPSKPTILLLHGFPASSLMYRELIPLLASRFHLVAPDYPGFGFSEAPGANKFTPTFADLARIMADFTQAVGLKSFIIYMQDYGGPVGFRIAVDHPEWVSGLIIQNANAYIEGFNPDQLAGTKARAGGHPTPEQEAETEQLVSPYLTSLLYKTGVRNFNAIDPAAYSVDNCILAQTANHRIQKALLIDYYDNVLQYPRWQAYMRKYQPRALIVWGKNDPIFLPAGAEAYKKDLPKAELHFFNTGHFALEEDAPGIARDIMLFYGR